MIDFKSYTDWSGARTLRERVIYLIENKLTEGCEFQSLLSIYGRPKLLAIWEKYRDEKKTEGKEQ